MNKSAKPVAVHPALAEQLDAALGLSRIADTLDLLDRLRENLAKADEIGDDLQKALFTLAYIRTAFEKLDLKAPELQKLERALSDVLQGHSNPLFEPRRKSKPTHTIRHKAVKVHAAFLLQRIMDYGREPKRAALQVKTALKLSGYPDTDTETILGWHKRYSGTHADPWGRKLYEDLLKKVRTGNSLRPLMTGVTRRETKQKAVKAAEICLQEAVKRYLG